MTGFNVDNLKNVIVQMKIPMAFDVLDSFEKGDKGKPYLIVIENIKAEICFKRVYSYRYKNDISEMQFKKYSKMEEDRNSIFSYMEVQICFDEQMYNSEKINKDIIRILPYQFIQESLPYLNKFINIYVATTNQFWLRRLVDRDILSYKYYLLDSTNNIESITSPFDGEHIIKFSDKPFLLEEEKDNKLRHDLIHSNYSWENDMVSFINNSFKLGMYNIALIQLAILFENFVYINLKENLSNTKLKKIKKKESCGCLVGISEICTRGILEHFNYDFASTDEWKNIKDNLLKFRNKIVHGEQIQEVSKEIYLQAQQAQQLAIVKLSKDVFK